MKKLKIKTQIVLSVAFILGIVIVLQLFLYSILQTENKTVINSIFDSITQNSVQQIKNQNRAIYESSSSVALDETVQASMYEYTPPEIIRNFSKITNVISGHANANENIAFLGLIKENSLFITVGSSNLYENIREAIGSLKKIEKPTPIFLPSFVHEDNTYFTCVAPIFPTKFEYYTPQHAGNFVICIYEIGAIDYIPSGVIDDKLIDLIITDEDDNILLSSDVRQNGTKFNSKQKSLGRISKTVKLENPDWIVTTFLNSSHSSVFSTLTVSFIVFMICFTIGMLFLMLKLLNDIIVKRIDILKESVERISKNDTSYRISYAHNDEFSVIITTINKVLGTVHNLNEEKIKTLDRLYSAELLQKETRIFYLYSQVSPHFLYNSLSHIQGLVIEGNVPKTLALISSLSKVFRYFSNNQSLSNVQKDLDCATEYFNVINVKRSNRITLVNNVDTSLASVPCLKMIYQPILENTLKHAFGIDNSGTVTISSIPHETKAIIEIKDDGRGIKSEKLDDIRKQMSENDLYKIQNSEHIGLLNVNMRLKLFYNPTCGIEINSKENEGTTIRVIFEKEPPELT